jgi:hypothetical protein
LFFGLVFNGKIEHFTGAIFGGKVKKFLFASFGLDLKECSKMAQITRPIPKDGSITPGKNFSSYVTSYDLVNCIISLVIL